MATAYDGLLLVGIGLCRPLPCWRRPMSAFRIDATAYGGVLPLATAYDGPLLCGSGLCRPFALWRWPMSAFRQWRADGNGAESSRGATLGML